MKFTKILTLCLLALLTLTSVVSADEALDKKLAKAIESTRWKLEYDNNGSYTSHDITLDPGGILRNHNPRDNTKMNDSWKVLNGQVIININNGFLMMTSKVIEADVAALFGDAQNKRGQKWTWRATKRKNAVYIVND